MMQKQNSWGTMKNKDIQADEVNLQQRQPLNIWEEQANEIEVIPDIDEQIKQQQLNDKKLQAPSMINQKVTNLKELEVESKKFSLQQKEVDLQFLIKHIRPYDEVLEQDDLWEFSNLKSEIYQIVSQTYGKDNQQ